MYIDPTGHSWWSTFWKNWGGLFGAIGGVIKGAVTGDWSAAISMASAFVSSAVFSGGNPSAIASSVLAAGFMDTPLGKGFSNFVSKDILEDTLGLSSDIARIIGNTVSYTIVSSAFYIGITTMGQPSYAGLDYTDSANRTEISEYAKDMNAGTGGSSANWIGDQIAKGNSANRASEWYPQGRVSSEVAFQDYPILGKALKILGIRHTASVGNVGGRFVDSAKDIPMFAPLKGQIPGLPWTGVCHQATVRNLIDGGMTGWQAVRTTASQTGWSFYLSSSIYGVEGHAGGVGLVNAVVNRER